MAKKGAQATPNQLLRRARLERGWTQRMVAERIGAPNDVIVTRWERGTAFPSPHYVQRLCELFEQSASELGLIKEAHAVITSHQLPRSQPLTGEEDGRAPSTPRHSIPLLSALPLIGALEALALLPETAATQSARVATLLKLIRISWMVEEVAQTLERLAAAEHLAQALHDHRQLAAIHYWTGVVYGTRSATRQAREYAERALRAAQELGDEDLVALACVQLSRVLSLQGQFGPIEELLTPIIPVLERTANWSAWTDALGCLGVTLAARGQCMAGVAQGRRAA